MRKEAREKLCRVISSEYSEKMARYYAGKLEAEIFSQHYASPQEYKLRADKSAEDLHKMFDLHGTADSFMITTLDYFQIEEFSRALSGAAKPTGKKRDTKNSPKGNANPDSHLSVSDNSLDQTGVVQRFCTGESIEEDQFHKDSFGNLESIAKYGEEDIRLLKETLDKTAKENGLLRAAFCDVLNKLKVLEAECQEDRSQLP